MLEIFQKNDIENEEITVNTEPVNRKTLENIIQLIDVANKIDCDFYLKLTLVDEEFYVDSESFAGIKIVSNKKEDAKLLIQHYTSLLSHDTYIPMSNIKHAAFNCRCSG